MSPQLVGDLRRLPADARIPATGHLFDARLHAGPISCPYAHRLVNRYAAAIHFLPTSAGD